MENSENQGSGAPSPAPETDDGPVHVEQPAPVEVPDGNKDTGRYSAYDTRLLKYVGGVHDTEAKAKAAAKDAGLEAGDFKVVEV